MRNSEVDGFIYRFLISEKSLSGEEKGESLLLPRLSFRLYKNNRAYFYSNDKHESITNSILNLNGEASLKILHLPIVKRANTLFFAEDFLINFGLEEEEEYHEQKIALLVKKPWKRKGKAIMNWLLKGWRRLIIWLKVRIESLS